MADLNEELKVNAPLDKVFAFLANPENRVHIYVNVAEVNKLTEGDWHIGSEFREVRQLTNRKVGSELKIIDLIENKQVAYESDEKGLKQTYRYFCEEAEGGTKVRFEGTVHTNSIKTKLMRPLLVKMVKKEEGDQLLNVKKYFEDEEE